LFGREVAGYTLVAIVLALSFLVILWIAALQIKFARVFPPVDCDAISNTYKETLPAYAYYDY